MVTSAAIGIICKAPRPGATKTRLAAVIGGDAAASASACFLRDVATCIEQIPPDLGRKGYGVYAPAGAAAELRNLLPRSFGLLLQSDANLGNVLYRATRELLDLGHDCVLLVNGDSPTLPSSFLSDAIERLRKPGDRMVLGPASDGGYYLIGLKHPHELLFSDIPWGTSSVARLTLERAKQSALDYELLPEWYDVDDAETFELLNEELTGKSTRFMGGGIARSTRDWLSSYASAVPKS
ncbi:MAG: TIGR04282 family arsenosugar biosynthesis glycosyltransferase [bacterium]|nr:TIGR04282 family arsenosugar biosynthesis glycosyltransferase [bacterium]